MSRRANFIMGGGIVAGLLLVVLLIYSVASQNAPAPPRPPELGGQQVPAKVYKIPFDRKYDLFCSFYGDEPTTYRNCKILGFTAHGEESPGSSRAAGAGGFSSPSGSGSATYYTEYFDHWLVLELADGRLAYIPANAIKYIEQASPQVK